MPHHLSSTTSTHLLPSRQGLCAFIFSSKTSLENGQSSPRLDKSFTSASKKVRCDIVKLCCAQLTLRFCSDQAAPTDTRETAAPSPSAKDQSRQGPSNDKGDDVALRVPSEPAPSGDQGPEDSSPARKRLKSPTTSVNADRTRSPSPNRRSKTKHNTPADGPTTDFPARPTARTKGRLWNEGDPIPTRNQAAAQPAPQQHPRQSRRRQASNQTVEEEDPSVNKMIGQPETRPISQEQLVAEVKGIYAGLVMYVTSCLVPRMSRALRCPTDRLLITSGSNPNASRLTVRKARKMIQVLSLTTNNGRR